MPDCNSSLQENLPFAVASMVSPSGMTLAGKYETGVLSIGSMSTAGLQALPTQWQFAEDSAKQHGNKVDRKNWRVLLNWHIAESREQAIQEAKDGLLHWHNEYTVGTLMRPGAEAYETSEAAVEAMAADGAGAAIIGTPDDVLRQSAKCRLSQGSEHYRFANDWANRDAQLRSWTLSPGTSS